MESGWCRTEQTTQSSSITLSGNKRMIAAHKKEIKTDTIKCVATVLLLRKAITVATVANANRSAFFGHELQKREAKQFAPVIFGVRSGHCQRHLAFVGTQRGDEKGHATTSKAVRVMHCRCSWYLRVSLLSDLVRE